MPGPYAHITLLHELIRPAGSKAVCKLSSRVDAVLATHFSFCALGAVSPDYPNLVRDKSGASPWADAMHYVRACEMIASGIRRVRAAEGAVRDKQLAWLLGYSAHVATDVTIHPVVQARVGVYAENRREHRICEMNQDSYIFRRMNLGEIGASDHYAVSVKGCSAPGDKNRLDHDIVALWQGMLADVHPELFAAQPPDPALWHREFVARAGGGAAGQARLFPLADVIAVEMELAYPAYVAVDRAFIEAQAVPAAIPFRLHYDEIFDRAAANTASLWNRVEQAADEDAADPPLFGDWNLDNGRDEHGRLVFWE